MNEVSVSLTQQELLALLASANAVVKSIHSILSDYELQPDESIDLNESERATLFANAETPVAKKSYTVGRSLVIRHPTLALSWLILRGSMLPVKNSSSLPAAAARYRAQFFADRSLVSSDASSEGLVLQDISINASKSVVCSICFGYAVSGPKYLPD